MTTQAERDAAVTRAAKRVVMSTWPRDNEGHEAADAIDELEEAARAAGHAEVEADVAKAQGYVQAANATNKRRRERNDDLEGALRSLADHLAAIQTGIEKNWNPRERDDLTTHRQGGVLAETYAGVVQAAEAARALLPKPSEGSD